MQGLLDYPRDTGITQAEVIDLLTDRPNVEVSFGLEAFSTTLLNSPVDPTAGVDISDIIMDGSSVEYDNTAKIGGTANLVLDPAAWEALGNNSLIEQYAAPGSVSGVRNALYWGNPRTRLRPYMTLTRGILSAKFYKGVYVPTSPQITMDSPEPVYSVTCYDQTAILDIPLTGPISFIAGQNVFNAVSAIFLQLQIGYESYNWLNTINYGSPSRQFAQLTAPMSWDISSNATYLDVINALLAAVGFNPLWCDDWGYFNITQWFDPRTTGSDWLFDQTDPEKNIVSPGSTWQPQVWKVPNTWIFIQNGLNSAPIEGLGLYTVKNQSTGPNSIDKQLGRVLLSTHTLDATSQADLESQGDKIVQQESMIAEQFTLYTSPLPIAGYQDCITFISDNIPANLFATSGPTQTRVCSVTSWQLPLNGDDMTWNVGTIG